MNGLPRYAALILDTPSEEEGGVPGWTLQNKIEDLHWCVRRSLDVLTMQARRGAAQSRLVVGRLAGVGASSECWTV